MANEEESAFMYGETSIPQTNIFAIIRPRGCSGSKWVIVFSIVSTTDDIGQRHISISTGVSEAKGN